VALRFFFAGLDLPLFKPFWVEATNTMTLVVLPRIGFGFSKNYPSSF
jgi:hypothetical protein